MFIAIVVIGILFWGYFFVLAGKEFKEGQIWKKEKHIIIPLIIIFAFLFLGFILWDTKAHDLGVIIVILSTVVFLWWGFSNKGK